MSISGLISQALIDRLEKIADGYDDDALDAGRALLLLKKLKRQDEFELSKTRPDRDGFYQALYVLPDPGKIVEVIRGPLRRLEQLDDGFWFPQDGDLLTVLRPDKWRYATYQVQKNYR